LDFPSDIPVVGLYKSADASSFYYKFIPRSDHFFYFDQVRKFRFFPFAALARLLPIGFYAFYLYFYSVYINAVSGSDGGFGKIATEAGFSGRYSVALMLVGNYITGFFSADGFSRSEIIAAIFIGFGFPADKKTACIFRNICCFFPSFPYLVFILV
jgi:hypothetical protein